MECVSDLYLPSPGRLLYPAGPQAVVPFVYARPGIRARRHGRRERYTARPVIATPTMILASVRWRGFHICF